ncbi:MAG: M28 family metallopeptidase [Promethearchaeota archaeon]
MTFKAKMNIEELENELKDSSKKSKKLNVDNAYRITEKLAFPRLVGSEGEKKAIEIITDEFKKAGYNSIYQENFKTSLYIWTVLRYGFFPIGICLILLGLTFFINPWLTMGIIIINIYLCIKMLGLASSSETKLSKNEFRNFTTENIFTTLKSKNSKVKVVFIGHWDSKSQTFPSSLRMILFMVALFGFIIIILFYLILSVIQLLFPFNNLILKNIMLYSCIAIALISNLNYFNKTGNESPGAYDNAGAVGVIIELARYFKINPVDNMDFVFLCPSSEELNLAGAKHFIQKHKEEFDKKSIYFINLDPIGGKDLVKLVSSYGIPRRLSSKKLKDLFLNSADKLNIKIEDIYLPTGAWSDYMPIVQEGFEACWLGSQPGLKYVHTRKDNMDLVSKQGLRNILLLCENVVNVLNNEYE